MNGPAQRPSKFRPVGGSSQIDGMSVEQVVESDERWWRRGEREASRPSSTRVGHRLALSPGVLASGRRGQRLLHLVERLRVWCQQAP
jgi:hypothetical protein